ncbi:IS1595 family transposase [Bradyrhizobium ottawaense]|uniref:IS1595 family transposase n=1 Tax=Bradyrhizobium ottawaense TaxID=931866 RepID=UPI001BA9D939|nr:IS1595 family transposase [Bradyrhizobium ottawaense]MBR1362079.1 IS1595 family transposase [Bradyrhizobium ottawaense]
MLTQFKTLTDLMIAFQDPQTAIDHFTAIRWPEGAVCPYCDCAKAYTLSRKNKFRCSDCARNFSVTVGTIFEDTKLPLRVWFGAIWLITNHPKGIASTTLARDLGITQKSAWFVLHRLRHAARTRSFNKPLTGIVEVDETYVGGKAINRHKRRSGAGGGPKDKTPVIGAVERDGEIVAKVLSVANKKTMHEFVNETVAKDAVMLATDGHPVYQRLEGYQNHEIVNHQQGEYKRGEAHTNSIESVWALLKRQIVGTHHWVSEKHLQKYVQEMTWRLNRRSMSPADRMNDLFECVAGALPYKVLIS